MLLSSKETALGGELWTEEYYAGTMRRDGIYRNSTVMISCHSFDS
jgi:hypothetical protein